MSLSLLRFVGLAGFLTRYVYLKPFIKFAWLQIRMKSVEMLLACSAASMILKQSKDHSINICLKELEYVYSALSLKVCVLHGVSNDI